MLTPKRIKFLAVVALGTLVALTGCSKSSEAESLPPIANLRQPTDKILTGGQPSKEDLAELASSGVKHVLNLRPASEMDWDEKSYVESLGMTYHTIPVAGAKDVNAETDSELAKTLKEIGDEKAFLHCASGNRVGAVIAYHEFTEKGANVETAISTGKEWGLTKLEEPLRTKLQEMSQ
ncbi:fused DSP-PTPase phosphatase/NAD kinase-like protein [Pelagicoccus albus]|uniref:DSP-PTPase phosphatase fused to NAD+ Kinase domain-containing protein n=1 Tax=Pelagicoccus albus TaxID=415222 RepID=A0A7X1B9C4_9BACT|nr:sulfur transferase domain-containing protein [Pelagicoccus albus]MBC2607966.1 hypothetical protein [Pelagicoccus albus]